MRLKEALVKAEQGYAIRKKDWKKGLYIFMDLSDGCLHWGSNELMFYETFDLLEDNWELF